MSFVAEFTIPPEALPFGDTLAEQQDMRIEVERIVPTQETAMPFFWVWGDDPESFLDTSEDESNVRQTQLLDRVDDGALFKAEWAPNAEVIHGIANLDATIIESEGTAEQWCFEVRAQNRETFTEFQQVFEAQDIPVSLIRLYDLSEVAQDERRSLTPEQRETLIQAYRKGYFEKPRQTTQEELGESFDISARAVSDRLLRGTQNLIESSLLPSGDQS